jgi:hypothetical protein
MINHDSLNKFKELYSKNYGEELSDKTALEKAVRILNLVKLSTSESSFWPGLSDGQNELGKQL